MNKGFIETCLVALSTLFFLGSVHVAIDASRFHEMSVSDYKTPYYTHSWLARPYTMLRVHLLPSRYETKMNAVRSEVWRVKETMVGDVRFWTLLARLPVNKDFLDVSSRTDGADYKKPVFVTD